MKRFLILIIAIVFSSAFANALPNFWYSGLAMSDNGTIIVNSLIDIEITINDGTTQYVETHNNMANEFGMFAVEVGTGDAETGDMNDILAKPNTTIVVRVATPQSGEWVTVEGASLVSVYRRSFDGSIFSRGSSNLQSAYDMGNTIDIEAVDETTQVERPVVINNPNIHSNLILNNENEGYDQTYANALRVQRGSTILSTAWAGEEQYDLSEYGWATVIFVENDVYYFPPGAPGQVLYIVNTLSMDGGEGQNWINAYFDSEEENYIPIIGGTAMQFVSDGQRWYPIVFFPFYG